MKAGGYDAIVRSEVGVVAWWTILVAAAAGVATTARISRGGWVFLGLLGAYAAWTGIAAALWTESAERSVVELSRVLTLLGIFTFALVTQGPSYLRQAISSIAAGITLVGLLALLSRFHPGWFPANEVSEVLPTDQSRLSYPLTYWNGVATLIAMGIPLLLWAAASTRHALTRALSVSVLPALLLAGFFTFSRGGLVEAAAGVVALLALHPLRRQLLLPLLLGAAGGAGLIAAAARRSELSDGLLTQAAVGQGTEMIAITLAVAAVTGVLAFRLEGMHIRLKLPQQSRRHAGRTAVGAAAAGLLIIVALGLPSELSDKWDEFKQPVTPSGDSARFASASGSGRYQWWDSAVDAGSGAPLTGIGPGTFEYWWARGDGGIPGFVRDAHSLYLESFAELGVIGLLLITAFVLGIIAVGATRSLRNRSNLEHRSLLAAATAAAVTFATAAAVDWSWEMTVLPVIFLILAAGLLGPRDAAETGVGEHDGIAAPARRRATKAAMIAIAALSILIISLPMLSAKALVRSQQQAAQGDLSGALESAQRARDFQPFAATPYLQEALVLEITGDLPGALESARAASENEATNWRTWFVLSRIEAEMGNTVASTDSYRTARALNPRSPLFGG